MIFKLFDVPVTVDANGVITADDALTQTMVTDAVDSGLAGPQDGDPILANCRKLWGPGSVTDVKLTKDELSADPGEVF